MTHHVLPIRRSLGPTGRKAAKPLDPKLGKGDMSEVRAAASRARPQIVRCPSGGLQLLPARGCCGVGIMRILCLCLPVRRVSPLLRRRASGRNSVRRRGQQISWGISRPRTCLADGTATPVRLLAEQ